MPKGQTAAGSILSQETIEKTNHVIDVGNAKA